LFQDITLVQSTSQGPPSPPKKKKVSRKPYNQENNELKIRLAKLASENEEMTEKCNNLQNKLEKEHKDNEDYKEQCRILQGRLQSQEQKFENEQDNTNKILQTTMENKGQNKHYLQFGTFNNVTDMMEYFKLIANKQTINFQYCHYEKDVPKEDYTCSPPKDNVVDISNTEITVFYKAVKSDTLKSNQFIPMSVYIKDVFDVDEQSEVRDYVVDEVVPYIVEKRKGNLFVGRPSIQSIEQAIVQENSDSDDKIEHCLCIGNPDYFSKNRGTTCNFGCQKCPINNGCKFFKSKTIEKFRLKKGGDSSQLSFFVERMANTMSNLIGKWAPIAFRHMAKGQENEPCRIGTNDMNCFSACTISVDFPAHPHVDKSDAVMGLTAIASFEVESKKQTLHWLPAYRLQGQTKQGIAFNLASGSVLLECAVHEVHAVTGVHKPNKTCPQRIAVICYLHQCLVNTINHSRKNIPN
jgi:Oxygenase domain of the 2OGFeDO superfamily